MKTISVLFAVALLLIGTGSRGDVLLDMVTIGDPGNPADPRPWGPPYDPFYLGSVSYTYQISKYEVTVSQYAEFLNAAAKSDPYGLYSDSMGGDGPTVGGGFINRSGTSGSYSYSVVDGKENQPVRCVDYWSSLAFCNWLENGQGSGSSETGSYNLATGTIWLQREEGAHWVIPTEDEWYKAAYYDPDTETYYDYPNSSSDVPAEPTDETTPREMNFGDDPWWGGVGLVYTSAGETTGQSPYGVYDLGGNVEEWTETLSYGGGEFRIIRGGSYGDDEEYLRALSNYALDPDYGSGSNGFRVAYLTAVPEPATIGLTLLGFISVWAWRRRGRR